MGTTREYSSQLFIIEPIWFPGDEQLLNIFKPTVRDVPAQPMRSRAASSRNRQAWDVPPYTVFNRDDKGGRGTRIPIEDC